MFGKTPRPEQYKDSMKKKRFEQSVTNKLIPTKLKLFYQEVISKKYLSSTNFGFQSGACVFKNLETVPIFF